MRAHLLLIIQDGNLREEFVAGDASSANRRMPQPASVIPAPDFEQMSARGCARMFRLAQDHLIGSAAPCPAPWLPSGLACLLDRPIAPTPPRLAASGFM